MGLLAGQGYNSGLNGTDWATYTPTITGMGTVTAVSFSYRQIGGSYEVIGSFKVGTLTATPATITLPNSATSSSLLGAGLTTCGNMYTLSAVLAGAYAISVGASATTVQLGIQSSVLSGLTTGASANASAIFTAFSAGTTVVGLWFSVPIQGLAANSVASITSINARGFGSATTISSTLATINWTTTDYDTNSALSAGTYTVPSAGKYQINSAILLSGTFVLNSTLIMEIQKNGTAVSRYTEFSGGAETNLKGIVSDIINCAATDTIRIQVSSSGTAPAIVSSNFDNYFSIAKVG